MMVVVPGKGFVSDDQQISVGPDCGAPQRQSSFYFRTRNVRIRNCSLRIQTLA
jgi:hypothetical protein